MQISLYEGLGEIQRLTSEDYCAGNNLSPGSLAIIKEIEDIWKISFIDNLPQERQTFIGSSFFAKNKKDYASFHANWIYGEKYFLGEKLGHEPNNIELVEDFERTRVPERFRLFYLLTYPEKMELRDDILPERERYALSFLTRAEEISGRSYLGYFSSTARCFSKA